MARVNLTSKLVETLPVPVGRKFDEYFDQRVPGLVLRVSAAGAKSWNAVYRYEGRARRLTFGRYPVISLDDARSRALEALCEVSRGTDPAVSKTQGTSDLTIAQLAALFVQGCVTKQKRARQTQRLIEREIIAHWGTRNAASITRRDVALLVSEIASRAPVLANRVLAAVRRMYSWAVGQGLAEANPCDRVERPTAERARERVLREGELRALWHAFDPDWAPLFQFCLLTAQRIGEVLVMRWSDIDGGWWVISDTKNGHAHRVPLTRQALEVLSRVPYRGEYVFATSKRPSEAPRGYRRAFQRACVAAGICDACVHDLRRTAATMMSSMGVSRTVVARILNHADRNITSVYDRYSYDAEKHAALGLWDARLHSLTARA